MGYRPISFEELTFHNDIVKYGEVYANLKRWAREELAKGSRVKASRIDRVANRIAIYG